jgi:hypothetical protein
MKTMKRLSHSGLGAALLALALLLISASLAPGAQARTGADDAVGADHRTVLIIGANRGIARQYSKAGWTVIGTARHPDRLAAADNGTFRTYSGEQMAW